MRASGIMTTNLIFKSLIIFLFLFLIQCLALAAPPCKGPNKNDPGCPEATADPAVVDSVTVDWLNEKLTVRGSGFTGSTSFLLGSSLTPLGTSNVTATQLDIPFSATMAAEVIAQGNYKLEVDGVVQLSVFIESQIVDPDAMGCPCESDWSAELGTLWSPPTLVTDCLEITGPSANDVADISGTIPTDPLDATVYPQYPISASFYPGEPDNSVCRLVEVSATAAVVDLVRLRINENQQAACAEALKTNICATVNALP